jgi:hypothetical protein
VTTTCTVSRDKGRIAYMVVFSEYKGLGPDTDPKLFLTTLVKKFAKDTKKKKDIKLNGFAGIELVLGMGEGIGKTTMTYRAYFVKGRLYQVMAITALNAEEKIQTARFLDSFKLKDKNEKKSDKDDLN